jgi:hypothetical protein
MVLAKKRRDPDAWDPMIPADALHRLDHFGWTPTAGLFIADLLRKTGLADLDRRAAKIEGCCNGVHGYMSKLGILIRKSCNERLCPRCTSTLYRRDVVRFDDHVRSMVTPLFITFAVSSRSLHDLDATVRFLVRTFRNVRGRACWKRVVVSGIASVEVDPDRCRRTWWVHVHVLLDAPHLHGKPRAEFREQVRATWMKMSGKRRGDVRFKQIKNGDSARILRYIRKPSGRSPFLQKGPKVLDSEQLAAFARAMKGHRTLITFGELHARKKLASIEAWRRNRSHGEDAHQAGGRVDVCGDRCAADETEAAVRTVEDLRCEELPPSRRSEVEGPTITLVHRRGSRVCEHTGPGSEVTPSILGRASTRANAQGDRGARPCGADR